MGKSAQKKHREKTHCFKKIPLHTEFDLLQINSNTANYKLNRDTILTEYFMLNNSMNCLSHVDIKQTCSLSCCDQ